VLPVPVVDATLQRLASGQQLSVAGGEIVEQRVGALPERVRVDPGAGQGLLDDEAVEAGGDAEPPDLNALIHATPLPDFPFGESFDLYIGNTKDASPVRARAPVRPGSHPVPETVGV